MARGSAAALLFLDAPVAKLLMLPLSSPASSLYDRLSPLSTKVSRYRHHVINLQTYISCRQPPKPLLPRNRPGFPLDPTELTQWSTTCTNAGIKLSWVALQSARRHLTESLRDFKEISAELSTVHPTESAQIRARITRDINKLESTLLHTRTKKWNRDGVDPRALPYLFSCRKKRSKRGGKRHRRHKESSGRNQKTNGSTETSSSRESTTPTSCLVPSSTVINLSEYSLTEPETSLLSRGLSFCPSTQKLNTHQLSLDLHYFYRRIRLRDYFFNHPSSENRERSALDATNLRRSSTWQPPKATITPEVEAFINSFHLGVQRAIKSQRQLGLSSDNLPPAERQALESLRQRSDIVIKPADKGSAVVVMSKEDYDKEALRQLADTSRYELLQQDPTTENNDKIRRTVDRLRTKNSINQYTARDLTEKKPRPARFYLLPKIHKSLTSPPGRPIVSSNGCPTERISAYVDSILKPLVTEVPSFLRDTKHLLNEISSLPKLPPHALLVTMDVVGLYNNIPHAEGVDACRRALDGRPVAAPPTNDVIDLMDLVLDLNCFTFHNKHYRQILGTAMGTRMAPSFANLFMAAVEEKILNTAPNDLTPEFFKRFIDDIIMIWLHGEENLRTFFEHANSVHPTIKFTMDFGRAVDYLDTRLAIKDSGQISSDLFVKSTDSHQYLLPSSNHPPHVHQHLPYGLALRLRQIVSEEEDLRKRLSELKSFLLARGYAGPDVDKQLDRAANVPRETALQNRQRSMTERVPLVCEWNERLPDFPGLLRQFLPVLQCTHDLASCFNAPPVLSYRRPRNLKDTLVKTEQPTISKTTTTTPEQGTFECATPRCLTCKSIHNIQSIKPTTSGLPIKIKDRMTCATTSLVYIITCTKCDAAYVGETGQKLRERLNGHRADIRNATATPVGVHFQQQGHELRTSGLERTSNDPTSRRVREKKWIDLIAHSPTYTCMNRDPGIAFLPL